MADYDFRALQDRWLPVREPLSSSTGGRPVHRRGRGTLRRTTHRLLRAITGLVEAHRLNVAVARAMELVNTAHRAIDDGHAADLTALAPASPAAAGGDVTRLIVRPPRLVNLVVPKV
jgi:hypothetical protein